MKPVIFLGTGDANLQIPHRICELRGIPVAGILDSDYFGNTDSVCGIKVIGSDLTFDFDREKHNYDFFIAQSGYTKDARGFKKRLQYVDLVEQKQLSCATLIHPTSEILPNTVIEPGCLVGFCVGISHTVHVGKHTQIHASSMIAHHVTIGKNCMIGPHSTYMSNIIIGNNVTVGPGAGILKAGKGFTRIGDFAEIHPRVTVARDVDEGELISLAGDNTRKIYGTVLRS